MLKIINKIQFSADQNRMKNIADIENAVKEFNLEKNKNLDFLLQKRFSLVSQTLYSLLSQIWLIISFPLLPTGCRNDGVQEA